MKIDLSQLYIESFNESEFAIADILDQHTTILTNTKPNYILF